MAATTTPRTFDTTIDRPLKVRRITETKAGVKTTEFLMAIAFVVAVVLAAYQNNSDSFQRQDGWLYAAIVATGYMISRGLAKAGVGEPYTKEIDAR